MVSIRFLDGRILNHETYTHCGVFHGLAATRADLLPMAASLVALRQHDDPPWFHYEDVHYHNSLWTLTALNSYL
jgi:hypothetical protein